MNRRCPGWLLLAAAAIALAAATGGTVLEWSAMPSAAGALPSGVAIVDAAVAEAQRPGQTIDGDLTRSVADPRPMLRLVVVDATTRAPLADAAVTLRVRDPVSREDLVTNPDGEIAIQPYDRQPLRLTIRCRDHVVLDAALPPVDGERAVVALQPAGTLLVRATDATGTAAAGIALEMLPPPQLTVGATLDRLATSADDDRANDPVAELALTDGVYSLPDSTDDERILRAMSLWRCIDRQRTTDESGEARWEGLPAAADYRFAILPPRHGDTNPSHERHRLTKENAGVTVRSAPPPGLSGPIAVAPGAPALATATLTADSTVRGHFRVPPGLRVPAQLFAVSQAGGDDVRQVTALDLAAQTTCADDGAFLFRDVRPGIYVLRSRWVAALGTLAMASATLRVPPGTDVDLGEIAPTAGSDLALRVQLTDTDGRPLAPTAVFRNAERALAQVLVITTPESHLLADTFGEQAAIPFAAQLQLCGLPPGLARVTVTPAADAERLPEVAGFPAVEPFEIQLPRQGCVDVPLRVAMGRIVPLDCRDEHGDAFQLPQLTARDRATRTIGACRVAEGESGDLHITLRDGEHELFAAVRAGAIDLYASATIAVPRPDGAPVALTFHTAAAVRGRLLDSLGNPIVGRMLRWTLPNWAAPSAPWLFCATTDAAGRFELHGAPVGVRLDCAPDTPALPLLAAGDNEAVLVGDAR